jgi:glycosyltransferase involved in cell wall biosynthesis
LAQVLHETPPALSLRSRRDHNAVRDPEAGRSGAPGWACGASAARRLHVLQIFQPDRGGVPTYVGAVVPGLIEAGIRVSVACPPEARAARRLSALGVELVPLELVRVPHPPADAAAVRRLTAWCVEHQVSLVHGHSTKAGMLAALTARRVGVPSLYTPHGWSFEQLVSPPLRGAYALFERHLVRRFHAGVVTVSASGRDVAERWHVGAPGAIRVVAPGLLPTPSPDRVAARAALGLSADVTLAVWVGRSGPQKRAHDLAPVARRLRGHARVLAVCGGAHGTPLERALRCAGVLLAAPDVDPALAYAAADMMLHTSDWEAAPLAVLEAMAAGLPVIAYDVGGVGEQVQAGRTGFLVAPRDVQMLAECALALARQPELRDRMGAAGRRRVAERFSYTAMVRELVGVYTEYSGQGLKSPAPALELASSGDARVAERRAVV